MQNIEIGERLYTISNTIEEDFSLQPNKNYVFDLSYLGSIDVIGEKSADFLQGQLSCDINKINNEQMQQGALCNLKGRILALLDVIFSAQEGYKLILPKDLLSETMQTLAKTALFSRVKLQPTRKKLYGLYVSNSSNQKFNVINHPTYLTYTLGNNCHIALVAEDAAELFLEGLNNFESLRGSLGWHTLRMQSNEFQIYPSTRGLFLPHRLDLHLNQYISFDKGCYKGQEIIARTHYRAKLKHGMKLFTIKTEEAPALGKRILNAGDGTEVGELVDYSPLGLNQYLIAASILFDYPERVKIEGGHETIILSPLG